MNILSVDIDFIFPDMNLIQKYMDTDLTPKQSWKVISWKTKNKKFQHCEESLEFIRNLISKKIKKETKVFSILEHDKIIKILEKEDAKKCTVFNVDYHHDVSYGNDDEKLNIENWVLHGIKKGMIEKYNWITQVDAIPCKHSIKNFYTSDFRDIDIDKLPKFDIIVFCTSRHFTPPAYWELNYKLTKITNYYINNLKTEFEYFKLVPDNFLEKIDIKKFDDFFVGENRSDFTYFYKGCIITMNLENEVPFFGIMNTGEPENIFKSLEILRYYIKIYGKAGFFRKKGVRNEVFIQKILKKYEIVCEKEIEEGIITVFKEKE